MSVFVWCFFFPHRSNKKQTGDVPTKSKIGQRESDGVNVYKEL